MYENEFISDTGHPMWLLSTFLCVVYNEPDFEYIKQLTMRKGAWKSSTEFCCF